MIEIIEVLGGTHEGKTKLILNNYVDENSLILSNEDTKESIIKRLSDRFDFNSLTTKLPLIKEVNPEDDMFGYYFSIMNDSEVKEKRILIFDGIISKKYLEDFKDKMYIFNNVDKIIYSTTISRQLSKLKDHHN